MSFREEELNKQIAQLTKERDEWKSMSEDYAKDLCEMEDALGFKQDQTDSQGAFIPTKGPWKERVRDLISKEGELGDLREERDQLAAKCAEMREALDHIVPFAACYSSHPLRNPSDKLVERLNSCYSALSDQCGAGWLSPEKKKQLENLHSHALLRIAKLVSREKVLVEALERIYNYPVHSEPVGGAYEMQDIASKALEACKI